MSALAVVPEFLRRSELTFEDLRELVETRYSLDDNSISLTTDPACDITKMQLTNFVGVETTLIGFFNKLIRLKKTLGWSFTDLDKVLHQFGGLSTATLVSLASMKVLADRLSLAPVTLVAFWVDIDADHLANRWSPALYEQTFLNTSVLNPIDSDL